MRAFFWMAGLSLVTLLLGATREMWIARELRAGGQADLFFRGLVVIGAARSVGLAVFRARWIPAPPQLSAAALFAAERRPSVGLLALAIAALLLIVGPGAWTDPSVWVAAACVTLALLGAALRALAERSGQLRRGFALDWALPIGTIAGAIVLPGGALGPALGLLVGVALAAAGQARILRAPAPSFTAGDPSADRPQPPEPSPAVLTPEGASVRARTRALLIDALTYQNLGVVEAALSHLLVVGAFALVNYASLFVNAALMVPSAAATVLALRLAAADPVAAHPRLRRWAWLGGLAAALLVALAGLALTWQPIARLVERLIGWDIAAETGALILLSVPFAGLRLANTIGRQAQVAADPRRLLPWDLAGLAGRALLLGALSLWIGVLASPLALAFAEAVQLAAWWRRPVRPGEPAR
jgi:hypothetical protein